MRNFLKNHTVGQCKPYYFSERSRCPDTDFKNTPSTRKIFSHRLAENQLEPSLANKVDIASDRRRQQDGFLYVRFYFR